MNIVFVISDTYTIYLYVAMASILKNSNSDDKFNFFIFHNGLSQKNKDELLSLKSIKDFDINFYQVDFEEELKDFQPWKAYNSRLCYYRLLLPQKVKEWGGATRCLYLDADIIVNGSLSEMYHSDLAGHALGLVASPVDDELKFAVSKLNLDKRHRYTYSGLMLVDIDKYIEEDFYNKALEIAKTQTEAFYWPDMDMLNILTNPNNYQIIAPKYSINPGFKGVDFSLDNFKKMYKGIYSAADVSEAVSNPVVWQLAGGAKPCAECGLPQIKKEFYKYTKGSCFAKQAKKWRDKNSWFSKVKRFLVRSSKKDSFGKRIKTLKLLGIPVFKTSKPVYDIQQTKFDINENTKCLVIAPHPDDEIIGMGGTLLGYAANFDAMCISSSGVAWKGKSGKERSDIRIHEFEKVMQSLKVENYKIFETYGDNPPFIGQIKKHYKEYVTAFDWKCYDYIFVPHPHDGHPEHRFLTNRLLKQILRQSKYKKSLKVVFYEVWAPLYWVNCFVNVTDVMEQKLQILKMYQSQIDATWDYPRWTEALNTYRSMNLVPAKYAEAFYICKVKDYLKMKEF